MAIADHERAAGLLQRSGEAAGFVPFAAASVEGSIAARFRVQAERDPTRVAISTDYSQTTYGELNDTACRIAAAALRCGRGNIAILCRPEAPAIAAMLGAVNAARAYVPLDPSFPVARLEQILDDVEADLIITDAASAPVASALRGRVAHVLVTDDIQPTSDSACIDAAPDAVAYVMYTSGSTGKPKGIAQTHRNLLHFIRSYTNSLRIGVRDRLSLLPPLSFSAALMDIYGALLNGATLCPYDVARRGSDGLAAWIDRRKITVLHSVPTLFRRLTLALPAERRFPTVRAIDLGGETVQARDVALYRAHFSRFCVLINHLACTEASVIAQYYIDQECTFDSGSIPSGPMADGITIHLTSGDGVASAGELVIESRYLSPGSWREAQRAAGGQPATLRTGDFGRFDADGMLVYLGRGGSYLKVRGHRIQPAEVEHALLAIEGVREALVVDRPAPGGDPAASILVAYLTSQDGRVLHVEDLRRELRTRLPAFMIPSAFVHLPSMPLTATGKIDRGALPSYSGTRPNLRQPFVEPNDAMQRSLAAIWSEFLGVDRVGIDDDFFELGGDSLLAVELVLQIETTLGRTVPPAGLTTARTVRRLAALLNAGAGATPQWVQVRSGDNRPPLLCFPGVDGTGLGFEYLCASVDPQRTAFAFPYPGIFRNEEPLRDVVSLAQRALSALRSVQSGPPYFLCGYSFGGLVAYETARQLAAGGQEVAFLALIDTAGPQRRRPRPLVQRLLVHVQRLRTSSDPHAYLKQRGQSLRQRFGQNRGGAVPVEASIMTPALDPVRHACIEAARAYRPAPYAGRVTLFRAPLDFDEAFWRPQPHLGWEGMDLGGIDVIDIPVPHAEILHPQHLGPVAQELRAALAAAVRRRGEDDLQNASAK